MKLKMLLEGLVEQSAVDFLSRLIFGTKWENNVHLAGGYVRDELLGLDPKDIDLVISNIPDGGIEFAKWAVEAIKDYLGVNKSFDPVIYPTYGTAMFKLRAYDNNGEVVGVVYNGHDLKNIDIECVMTRKEKYTDDSRNPDVEPGSLEDDVFRRDFTVNSLLKNLSNKEILDLTGMGRDDLQKGVIKTALDPEIIFKEDPLRMLRAIRFCVKYDWTLPFSMIKAIKNNAYRLEIISEERIMVELNKILISGKPSIGIRLLQLTGLSKFIFPELDRLIKLKQNKYHSKDAMDHTLDVLSKTPPDLITRLSALFHDIGKTDTIEVINDTIHFYNHEDVGAELAKNIMQRLKYPNNIIEPVVFSIKKHMKTKYMGDDPELSDKKIRKLQDEMGEHLEHVLDLIDADNKSHAAGYNLPNQVSRIRDKIKNLGNIKDLPKLPVTGLDVMNILGIKSGAEVGSVLKKLHDYWLENPHLTKAEAMELIKKINPNKN